MEGVRAVGAHYLGHDGPCASRYERRVSEGRQHPAHPPILHRHSQAPIVLLTVCTKDRKPLRASADSADAILRAWIAARSWLVGRYIMMPDHIHLFCRPATFPAESLEQWVRYWKNTASRNWPRTNEHPIWQRDFWDTQLRRMENYGAK
jgi:putative transposase